jgi:hypothetical protein
MSRRCPLLISFWIERTDHHWPYGFGVTAWSVDDAFTLIGAAGFSIAPKYTVVRQNVLPHEVDYRHVAGNSGPAVLEACGIRA